MIKKNHITAAALAGAMIFSMIPAGSAFAKTSYTYKPLKEAVYFKNSETGKWRHSFSNKYTYDKKGRKLTSKYRFSKWSYSYGKKSITFKQSCDDDDYDYRKVYSLKKNRIDKVTETSNGTILSVDKYSYNSKGLNTKIYHYLKDNELLKTITMTYNAKKQMTKRVTKSSGSNDLLTELFTYNKSGQIISEVHTSKTKTSTKTSTTKTTYYKSGKAKGLIASRTYYTKTDGSTDEKWRYTFKKVGGKYLIASEIKSSRYDDDPFTDESKIVYSNYKKMPVYSDPYHVFATDD